MRVIRHIAFVSIAAVSLVGCAFEPTYGDAIMCGAGPHKCPPGLLCSPENRCVRTLSDAAVSPMGDGAVDAADVSDAASSDVCWPGEFCNGFDDDCNGSIPAEEMDLDRDGYLPCSVCSPPLAQGLQGCGDCLPMNPMAHPGATELCDGFDTDCAGGRGSTETDDDVDGFLSCSGCTGVPIAPDLFGCDDCDDGSNSVHPSAAELCDGLDNDCKPATRDGLDRCLVSQICCDVAGSGYSCLEPTTTMHCLTCSGCDSRSDSCGGTGCVCGSTGAPCPSGMTCSGGACQP